MKEITITISKDGSKVETDATGFVGSSCRDAAEKLVGSLGRVHEKENKVEFYQEERESLEQKA